MPAHGLLSFCERELARPNKAVKAREFLLLLLCRTSSSSHISLVSSSETGAFVPKSGLEGQGFSLLHSKAFVAAKTGVRANGTLRSGFRRLRRQQQQQQ